jgi:O-antigen/teichoic acid export membrane protein
MHAKCPRCGFVHEREPGYFIGAITINMAATFLIVIAGHYLALWLFEPRLISRIKFRGLFSVAFPVLFFRLSRGLWMNIDYTITGPSDPREGPAKGISGKIP